MKQLKNRPFNERLAFAIAGLREAWRRENSLRTHGVFAGLAFLALLIIRPPAIWWALVAVVIAMVIALEMLNAAIEAVIDLLHPAEHPEIKFAKDAIAGAVLTISFASLIAALALFVDALPTLIARFR